MIFFVFYVYRPQTSKNAKGITDVLAGFRERTCSRKEKRQYTGKPEERGLYLSEGVFIGFRLKIIISLQIINTITPNAG